MRMLLASGRQARRIPPPLSRRLPKSILSRPAGRLPSHQLSRSHTLSRSRKGPKRRPPATRIPLRSPGLNRRCLLCSLARSRLPVNRTSLRSRELGRSHPLSRSRPPRPSGPSLRSPGPNRRGPVCLSRLASAGRQLPGRPSRPSHWLFPSRLRLRCRERRKGRPAARRWRRTKSRPPGTSRRSFRSPGSSVRPLRRPSRTRLRSRVLPRNPRALRRREPRCLSRVRPTSRPLLGRLPPDRSRAMAGSPPGPRRRPPLPPRSSGVSANSVPCGGMPSGPGSIRFPGVRSRVRGCCSSPGVAGPGVPR